MSTDEAIRLGLIICGPLLSLVGAFFSVSISANPHINGVIKGLAWALAPIIGLIMGSTMASQLLPDWPAKWGVAMMFGHGFFYTWIAAAALGHDDSSENYGIVIKWLKPKIEKAVKRFRKQSVRIRSDELADYLKSRLKDRP